jgi:hypothetical protein
MIGIDWNALNIGLSVIVSIGFLVGFVWATAKAVIGYRKWRRKKLTSEIATDLAVMVKEMRPNGGSSLRDAIDRIERKTDAVVSQISEVNVKIERHLGEHEGLKPLP